MDYVRHKSDEEKLRLGGKFDVRGGDKVIKFIEDFLVLESGRKFEVLPWMREVIHSWYSWFRPDGLRFTKTGLLTCARKNGKSILTYGLTAYHLIADGQMTPRCASVAVNKEQASQIYEWFKFAKENNVRLTKALHEIDSKKTILYPAKNGHYRSLSSDVSGKFGHGHSFVCLDEMSFFRGQKNDIYTALKDSGKAIPNSMQVLISTSGFDKNNQFFKMCQYGQKVLKGEIIDTAFQPWIYEVPEGADLDDEANWYLANPSLGVCQSVEDFRNQWNRDKQDSTTKHAACILNFNQYKDQENVWIPVENWEACKGTLPPLEGRECVLGCDVGATRDLTSIAAVFRLDDGRYAVKAWSFVPEGALRNRDGNANAVLYDQFSRAGALRLTPGTATNEVGVIIPFFDELRAKYKVRSVVFDKWQSIPLSNHCERHGIEVFNHRQMHANYHGACIELEKLVGRKQIVHDGDPLLRWQVGHTYLDRDGKGYVKPATNRPENKKDTLMALLMGLGVALQRPAEAKPSVYEGRRLFAV